MAPGAIALGPDIASLSLQSHQVVSVRSSLASVRDPYRGPPEPIYFTGATSCGLRSIVTNDGSALRGRPDFRHLGDARLAHCGTISNWLLSGTLEITGDILGSVSSVITAPQAHPQRRQRFKRHDLSVTEGTLEFANDASLGTPDYISISSAATLDASAMTVPVSITPGGSNQIEVNGVLNGSVLAVGTLRGIGEITGNVVVQNSSNVSPEFGGTLRIGGDLTIEPGAYLDFNIQGTTPETDYIQLSGRCSKSRRTSAIQYVHPQPATRIHRHATVDSQRRKQHHQQHLDGFTEGAITEINGFRLQITYAANGDGGPVANDFAVTVLGPVGGDPFKPRSTPPSLTQSGR